ncbi:MULTISPECIES: DUF983 domain-containing protein [unclassified Imperialibacter]|uniref:DUF983 domain-containing protein n=1 Tax=unclassified Imperialibacter TaxID=2629706 RepID=UPI001252A0A0|nr:MULTISPECIES: DUF983 domain-containing protein [unclassified Imperialibacter]CAD5251107.1 conserved hypothetical protein [Imperialibacter sp. 89]CAD5284016.1 conserved hypothetical protein [Imperialibacter sp. 75]VVT10829.1 conserved hypothetical protein [Imperialibacter sp. EC-SDR9]
MKPDSSLFKSIVAAKCPRCREGRMFPAGTLYHPTKFAKMNESCSCCGQSFEPEPGYYFGAMFVSYGLNTIYFVAAWLILDGLLDEVTTPIMFATLAGVTLALLPLTFRWSRSMWISIFVRYQGNKAASSPSTATHP